MKDYYFVNRKEDQYLYIVMDFYQSNLQLYLREHRKNKKNVDPGVRKVLAFQLFKALYYLQVFYQLPRKIMFAIEIWNLQTSSSTHRLSNSKYVILVLPKYFKSLRKMLPISVQGTYTLTQILQSPRTYIRILLISYWSGCVVSWVHPGLTPHPIAHLSWWQCLGTVNWGYEDNRNAIKIILNKILPLGKWVAQLASDP